MDTAHDHDRILFERLCLLRSLYVHRGDQDSTSSISTADAMRHAEELLEAPRPSSSTAS